MANAEHLKILKQGIGVWNNWRKNNPDVKPDLSYANLDKANLNESDLRHVNLLNASLSGASLISANLKLANLAGANLNKANLYRASLNKANLRSAGLFHTNLVEANLTGAEFSMAAIGWTVFGNNELSTTKGLDAVHHVGPSTIGIDTIYKSGGKIPNGFLQGSGIPDEFIAFHESLVGATQAIQFYSCFISYSRKDESFAKRLHSRMKDMHIRAWFAPEDVKGGEKLHEQIESAIKYYDKLLVVLSENSMQSEWVMTEIRNARRVEIEEKRRKLFPIRLVDFDTIRRWKCFDADAGKDLAVEVREYFIPDFSNWKDHDAFEVAFDRLIHDLQAEGLH